MTGDRLIPPTPTPNPVGPTRNLRRPVPPSGSEPVPLSSTTFSLNRAAPERFALPVVIGRYLIEGELGRGGMGVVYRALDPQLNRTVALKLLPGIHLASEDSQRRFRIEAEATARLHHPSIVQIHELGTHQEPTGTVIPYLALEYVEGGTLSQRLRGRSVPPLEAAALVEQLAHAIQHAHQHNIVHRDLKPSNVLLTTALVPRITDFGLALRLEDQERLTQSGAAMGTPAYMAPEQAAGRSHDTGPPVDIYALGAILYECLTGRPPFDNSDTLVCLQQLVHDDPLPPRRLCPAVPRDLETICLKCLEKEPGRRYASAAALADDLRGFQEGLPIAARPVGRLERGLRWCRRRPLVSGLIAGLVLMTLLGISGVTWKYLEADEQRALAVQGKQAAEAGQLQAREAEAREKNRAEEAARQKAEAEKHKSAAEEQSKRATRAADEAQRLAYSFALTQAHRDWRECKIDKARQTLADCQPSLRGWEHAYLERLLASNQRSVYCGRATSLALSPDGQLVAVGHDNGVSIFEVLSTRLVKRLALPQCHGVQVAFHPGGERLALIKEAQSAGPSPVGQVELWDWKAERRLYTTPNGAYCRCLRFSPDGKRLLCSSYNPGARVLDADTGQELLALNTAQPEVAFTACFTPDGAKILSTRPHNGSSSGLRLWDAQTGKWEKDIPTLHVNQVWALAFSSDGKCLATGSTGGEVHLWNWREQKLDRVQRSHTSVVTSLAFDRGNERLVSCGFDNLVVVWPFAQNGEPMLYRGHTYPVSGVTFTPAGHQVISGGTDHQLKWWDVTSEQECRRIPFSNVRAAVLAYHPDGQRFATLRTVREQGQYVGVVDLHKGNGPPLWSSRSLGTNPAVDLEFSADGNWLLVGYTPGGLELFDVNSGARKWSRADDQLRQATFDPTGQHIAAVSRDGILRVCAAASGEERLRLTLTGERVQVIAYSADGRQLLTGTVHGEVKVRRADTGAVVRVLRGLPEGVSVLAVSRDGRLIAAGNNHGVLAIWEGEATQARLLRGHTEYAHCLNFNARGDRLVSGSRDGSVKMWRTDSGHELLTLSADRDVKEVRFLADERLLMSYDYHGTIRVWDCGATGKNR